MKRKFRRGAKNVRSRASSASKEKRIESEASSSDERIEELFDWLYTELREAKRLYEAGDRAGRDRAIHALKTITVFLMEFKPIDRETLHLPLVAICNALTSLNDGETHALLQKVRRRGRGRDSEARRTLKGVVAFTVQELCAARMSRDEAYRVVALVLQRAGTAAARGGSKVTIRTVRGWCEETAADVGRRGEAAQTFDLLERDFVRSDSQHSPLKSSRVSCSISDQDIRAASSRRTAAKNRHRCKRAKHSGMSLAPASSAVQMSRISSSASTRLPARCFGLVRLIFFTTGDTKSSSRDACQLSTTRR